MVNTGGNLLIPVTLTSRRKLDDVQLQIAPSLRPFLTVDPAALAEVTKSETNHLSLVFSVPTNSPVQVYQGEVRACKHNHCLENDLQVIITITTNPVSLQIPASFRLNAQIPSADGSLSFNNFGNNYIHGGFVPPAGAAIDITSIPTPQVTLSSFITNELQGALITASTTLPVAGTQGTEVFYSEDYAPTSGYRNVGVYVPIGQTLHKMYLTYEAGDPQEKSFLASFQQIISTIKFAQ